MKRILFIFLFISQFVSAQTSYDVMTYNIRLNVAEDGKNAWEYRKDSVAAFLREQHPDIFGLQEVLHIQLQDVMSALPEYQFVGVGRLDGKTAGEYSPVFFKASVFELVDSGTFWLSETPDVPGSKSWDAAYERISTWACLRDRKTKETLFVFNTHFDHIGKDARFNSAGLILDMIKKIAVNNAVVLLGDFNSPTNESAYQRLVSDPKVKLIDSRETTQSDSLNTEITFTGFDQVPENDAYIDFIFINERFKSLVYQVKKINDRNFYFSDHLPVVSEIQFVR
jgi:endonuclease/exonuclease/phosphatase family metal-dependent hydrolase